MKCCVLGCSSRSDAKGPDTSFHRFPKQPGLRKLWIEALRRPEGWCPSKWSVVCCLHFSAEDFKDDVTGMRRLNRSAIPMLSRRLKLGEASDTAGLSGIAAKTAAPAKNEVTVFVLPVDPRDVQTEEAGILERAGATSSGQSTAEQSSSEAAVSCSERPHNGKPVHPSLHTIEIVYTPESSREREHTVTPLQKTLEELLRQEVQRYAAINAANKKKIKLLQQSQRRLKRRVADLENEIKSLAQEHDVVMKVLKQ
ncbi:uncharacterized protein [Dermacentor andersoni]|uniref:uncharacterized protein n=1 Tax=Dermacentor andersoni TaxID=34620 RepID=UPI002417215A|nr:THAP domain-containing protein 1 A-like [Dermacentor andersoni]